MVYIVIAVIVLAPIFGLRILSALAKRPDNLCVTDGKLTPCPDTPNCVCTQETTEQHRMEPISFDESAEVALRKIKAALADLARTQIITETDNYIHAESTSLLFRYVDDVEFYVDAEAKVIHFRSASRVGRSDMGANRRRMERIRKSIESARK